jgi:predicted transcriptional regulator
MSSKKSKKIKNFDFVERFIEVCGGSQPADVARLLNISYQAAKNYLQGRLPDANVLKIISRRTSYSIHWLLTGEGKKFVENNLNEDTLHLSDQMRAFVRRECLEIINEVLNAQKETAQQKVVVLTSENIKEEKIIDETSIFSGKQQ